MFSEVMMPPEAGDQHEPNITQSNEGMLKL